jgi:hypothetical protein
LTKLPDAGGSPLPPDVAVLEGEPLEASIATSEVLDPGPPPNPLALRDVAEWAGEPPAVPWLARRIHLAPGRPLGLIGYAGVGKTLLAAELALAVAGKPEHAKCWGGVTIDRQGSVAHVDVETGELLMRMRYHRLAVGRWAHITDWSGRLSWVAYPRWSLMATEAEEHLVQTMDGRALVIIDSLVMVTPGVDENSSRIADCLGIIARASQRTGACVVVLHHAGRPPAEGQRAVELEGRGSSSIEGMWGSKWVVRPGDGHLSLTHGKTQWGERQQPMRFQIENVGVPDGNGDYPGVKLVGVEVPAGASAGGDEPEAPGAMQRAQRAIIDVLRANGELAYGKLLASFRAGDAIKKGALAILKEEGRVAVRAQGKERLFSLTVSAPAATSNSWNVERFDEPGDVER